MTASSGCNRYDVSAAMVSTRHSARGRSSTEAAGGFSDEMCKQLHSSADRSLETVQLYLHHHRWFVVSDTEDGGKKGRVFVLSPVVFVVVG
jgi:hypothetical protein